MSRRPPKPFSFDRDYQSSAPAPAVPAEQPRSKGLVPFFSDEPVEKSISRTEWTASSAPEEDLREGMDDYHRLSKEGEDDEIKQLIASMPHNKKS